MPAILSHQRSSLVVLLVAVLLTALSGPTALGQSQMRPGLTDGDFDPLAKPPELRGVTVEQKIGAQVPLEGELRDEDGNPVTLRELMDGQPILLDLGYYECPVVCPIVKRGIATAVAEAERDLGDGFRIISVSIDPDETPAVARAEKQRVARQYGMSSEPDYETGWRFLTGPEPSVSAIAQATGYGYKYLPGQDEYGHAPVIIFLSPDGVVSSYLPGSLYPKRQFDLALGDAADGRGGSIFEQVLQWCYRFDPNAGEYVMVAKNVMTIGGVVVLVAVVGGIGGLFWWERKRSAARGNGASGTAGVLGGA